MPPVSSAWLDHYVIRSSLGAGGMGEVYLAEDTRLNRLVALKLWSTNGALDQEAFNHFIQEARAASSLNHPNILTIYDVGETHGKPYIAAEYVDGVTLRQHILNKQLSLIESLDIALQLTNALEAAHAVGLVHCDIKPENIMLRRDGLVKVLDFGLAAFVEKETAHARGTLNYLSPEQTRGEAVDARSDLWSLGITLFEMLTGCKPFARETRAETLRAIQKDEAPTIGSYRSDAPLALENVLRHALAKNPNERYQSAREFADDLKSVRALLKQDDEAIEIKLNTEPSLDKTLTANSSSFALQFEKETGPVARLIESSRNNRRWILFFGLLAALAVVFDFALVKPRGGERWRDVALVFFAVAAFVSYFLLRRRVAQSVYSSTTKLAFRGLLPFQEADRERFFGRETDTQTLFEMVSHRLFRFGVLFGESGCGKTSLLQAGLTPKLWASGCAPIYCRSFKDPLASIRAECKRQSGLEEREDEAMPDYLRRVSRELDAPLVIICDQFEEFFVNFKTAKEREPFVSLIARCNEDESLPIKFLCSMRSDFLYLINSELAGRVSEPLLSSKLYHLRNFDEDAAVEVIERSTRKAGLCFERGLSRTIARDLAGNGNVLPSELQIVGERLQQKRIFTIAEYRRAGGKETLVHSFLEDVIEMSGDKESAALLLRSLISDEDTRLTLTLEEIARRVQRSDETVTRLLEMFAQARLIRVLQDEEPWRYELMHEYLIEKINKLTGRVLDATQRANRLLRRYLSEYAVDQRARIPLGKLWLISRHSDAKRCNKERDLIRKSWRSGLLKLGALALLIAVGVTIAAATFSVREEWTETQLRDGHTAAALQIAFSPDGRLLASVGDDGKAIVWDFARRERIATLTGHTGQVFSVAFSPDGRFLATADNNYTIIVWDTAEFKQIKTLPSFMAYTSSLNFSPDGNLLAAMSGQTLIWKTGTWEQIGKIKTEGSSYGNFVFSNDSRSIITCAGKAFDVKTGQRLADSFDEKFGGNWMGVSKDMTRAVTVSSFGFVTFLDLVQRKPVAQYKTHDDHGRAVAFSPDGRFVATGSENIALWDVATQTKITRLDHTSIVWALAFSPDGRFLVSSHGDGSILVWSVKERERVASLNEHSGPVRSVAYSLDGQRIASSGEDRSIIVWNAVTGQKETTLIGHKTRITAVAFSPDGKRLASVDQDGFTFFWDLASRQPLWSKQYLQEKVMTPLHKDAVTFSPDGRLIADSRAVYESASGNIVLDFQQKLVELKVPWSNFYGVAFSPDGQILACCSPVDGHFYLWDTATWQIVAHFKDDYLGFISISFSPDGQYLVTGDEKTNEVLLWQVNPLRPIALLGKHKARVKSVAFSPDGRFAVSAGDDHTVALWDVNKRSLVRHIGTHTAPVLSVAFSPDGKRIVTGEHDKSVRIYERHRKLWGYKID